MIYPEFPSEGDVIGICAPSAGIGSKEESFEASLDTLNAAGFNIFTTDSIWNEDCPSAPDYIRGDEFNSLYEDDDIAMVMSAAGGDYNIEMLPFIDQELVSSHPKWFCGYSDPTCIEMLLTTKLDIATIYGVNAGSFDWSELHEFQENALSIMYGDIPVQHSYDLYSSEGFDEDTGTYIMDTPVDWTLLRSCDGELEISDELDVSGRLIGGCIDVIDWLIGTPYEDLQGFCERYSEDGFIWFFDNFELTPPQLFYAMIKMKLMGLFDNAKCVIFGRVCFYGDAEDLDYIGQLERVFGDMDVPIIWGADIGHTKPSMTIINGSMGHLEYEDGQAILSMELK